MTVAPAVPVVADPRAPNPLVLADQMAGIYEGFVRTSYALAAEGLASERAAGLRGQLAAETLIEPVPSYRSSGLDAAGAVVALNLGQAADFEQRAGEFLDRLMDGNPLYSHQWEAMRRSVAGEDVCVTGGTGSGKTEAFWLPVLTQLLLESERWTGHGATPAPWWEADGARFRPSRQGETGRPAGIRALVLYPMNALVEDQLVRLRRALDSDDAEAWFATHRDGHRFTFGRYTGQTPKDDLRGRYSDWARRAQCRATARRRRTPPPAGRRTAWRLPCAPAVPAAPSGCRAAMPPRHDRPRPRHPRHQLFDAQRHDAARRRAADLRRHPRLSRGASRQPLLPHRRRAAPLPRHRRHGSSPAAAPVASPHQRRSRPSARHRRLRQPRRRRAAHRRLPAAVLCTARLPTDQLRASPARRRVAGRRLRRRRRPAAGSRRHRRRRRRHRRAGQLHRRSGH